MTRLISATAAVAALWLSAAAHAASPGITSTGATAGTFNLVATDGFINQPDGEQVYVWGYGCTGAAGGATPATAAVFDPPMPNNNCSTMQIPARSTVLPAGPMGQGVAEAVRSLPSGSVLVLWLRADDLAALGDASSAPATVYVSGLMGGLERSPLPPSWRGRTKMAYPYDLPENRDVRLRYALSWFSMRHIPVVDEPLQVDTYLACGLLAETLSHMADNLVQPFIVEMLQSKVERRLFNTGYYPHLVLGWNQHFASKGGYIVHFAQPSGSKLVADSNWTVP